MKSPHWSVTLIGVLLLVISSQASLAQNLSPVQFLPGEEMVGPAAFNQEQPTISRGGNQYLVAWTDYRTGSSPLLPDEGGADIYVARLDATGQLIDTTPIPLTQAAGDQTQPEVSWNGINWLVVWLSQTPTQFFWSMEVQAARVSPGGVLLDPTPITVYKYASSTSAEFAITSDGANWAVVTRGTSGGDCDLIGIRVAADGSVPDPRGIPLVSCSSTLTFSLDMDFAVDEYLLVYILSGDVYFRRLDTNLVPKDANAIRITNTSSSEEMVRVASNGSEFFVLWNIFTSTTQVGEARGTRVTYDGVVLDHGGLAISGLVSLGVDDPRVTWDGANWVTTFKRSLFGTDPDELRAARVTTGGRVLDPGGVVIEPIAAFFDQPEITQAVGRGVQIVWKDNRAGGEFPDDVSTFFLSRNLIPGIPSVVSFGAPAQTQTDLAAGRNGYILVFRSSVSGENRIMAHPLDANGHPLLTEPVRLASDPFLAEPAVAWNGSLYLVVWSDVDSRNLDNSVIYAQRIAPDGALIDPNPITVMEGFNPDVAAAGDLFLVVAIQQTINAEVREPFGVRVRGSDGAVLDPTPIDLGFSFARRPAVAGLGNRWLMAYQRNFTHDDPHADIYANFIESNGTTSGTFVVATGLASFLYDPDLATDGTNALVIWEDSGTDNIGGARVLNDGSVESLIIVSEAPEAQDNPALTWNGTQYVALYEDLRNISFFLDKRTDIFGTRITPTGTPVDPEGFAVFDASDAEIDPALAGANGITLLAGSIFRSEAPYAAYRIGLCSLVEAIQTGTLQGTVRDATTGLPISGAVVDTGGGLSTTTNASGFYQIDPISTGVYTVTASANGYLSGVASGVVISADAITVQDFNLTPVTGCSANCLRVTRIQMGSFFRRIVGARVTVVDENGNPVSAATVSGRWDLPGGDNTDQNRPTNTSGRATFLILDTRPGTYTITVTDVQKTGYQFDPAGSTLLSNSITR